MFVSIRAPSVVSSSLPRIVSDLHGSQQSYTWVVTATLLTTTVTTPIWVGIDPSLLGGSGASLPDVSTLPAPVKNVVESAFGAGVAGLFLIGAPIALVALVAVLFLKEVALDRKSGIEQPLELETAKDEVAAR